MSAVLSAVLRGEDNLSSIFDNIANSGARMVEKWQTAGTTASSAFAETTQNANVASKAIDEAASSAGSLSSAITDFDKSAAGAIDTTAELAEMGFKTEDALSSAAEGAGDAASAFNNATGNAEDFRAELDDLSESAGDTGGNVSGMASKIESVLVSAGIAALVGRITQAVIEMGNEFSRAEATIVRSSGATGRELRDLQENMFNVFATARGGDLTDVATAITEVNTRMRLQGDELERVTSLFMDYADMNNTNVASSIRTVSQLMTRWQIDAADTAGVLDRLTLAGQMSGKSVDNLSYELLKNQATFDALNFTLDESIAMLAALEAGGINSQAVMYGLRRSVVYMSKEGKDAAEGLREIIDEIANLSSEADATAMAVEAFGVRAGPEMAFAIRNGKLEIDEWIAAISEADGTLARTAAAATTLEERWTQASNQMSAAFSSTLGPAVSTVSGAFADMKMGVAEFLADNPAVVAILTGLAAGFMAVAGGLALYKLAMTIGTVVTAIFGTTLSVALWPLTLIVAAIAAVTAGFILLFNWIGNANAEFNSLTATSKVHYEAVQDLRREYERATLAYGENSDEVRRLAGELEAAQLVFEANRLTIEAFIEQNDRLIESHRRVADGFRNNIDAINTEERSAISLIGRLADLSMQTNLTAAEQMQMAAVVDELNSRFPDMALAIDDITGSLNLSVEAMREMAQAQAAQERMAAQHQAYLDALSQELALRDQLTLAAEIHAAATHAYESMIGRASLSHGRRRREMNDAREEYERLSAALAENLSIQASTEAAWEAQAQALQEAANAAIAYEDAVNRAIQTVAADIETLAARYDEAFAAASRSISGQFNLWEEAAEVVPKSIEAVTAAMETQIAHWQAYNENLAGLSERTSEIEGLADLINSFADGSPQSIAMIAGMSDATDEELASMVSSWQELQAEQDAVSHSLAELATDFSNGMSEIEARMHEAIDNMNMDTDAAQAARETISAYINQIRAMTGEAHSAAEGVARAATNALGGRNISLVGVPGFATGTTNAPDMFIAGEEGPELIVGASGSTVFTANETREILTNTHQPLNTTEPDVVGRFGGSSETRPLAGGDKDEKRISLSIDGRGELKVTGGVDEETVWEFVAPRLKEAFFGILQEEIFEEGDVAHAF